VGNRGLRGTCVIYSFMFRLILSRKPVIGRGARIYQCRREGSLVCRWRLKMPLAL
jgi:hypothetical protein